MSQVDCHAHYHITSLHSELATIVGELATFSDVELRDWWHSIADLLILFKPNEFPGTPQVVIWSKYPWCSLKFHSMWSGLKRVVDDCCEDMKNRPYSYYSDMYKEGLKPVCKTCDKLVSTDIPPPLVAKPEQSTLCVSGRLVSRLYTSRTSWRRYFTT